jgi:tetratricopeptide (TPR) repeat protein
MAKKLSRADLKRDEVIDTVGRGWKYLRSHRKGAFEAVVVAAGLGLLVGAFFVVRAYRERQASEHLSKALAILSTPLRSDPSGESSPYGSGQERVNAAQAELKKAASLSTTEAGREAEVILAADGEGKQDVGALDRFARSSDSIVAAAAELDAVRILESQGKTSQAIERLKRAIESSRTAAPKPALLAELARLYEKNGNSADAAATRQRLASDYPQSPYASGAAASAPGS